MNKINKKEFQNFCVGYLFILPVVLGLLIFTLYPVVQSLYLSFFKIYNGMTPPTGFGVFNYIKMLTLDDLFWESLGITFSYTILMVPITMFLSFLLALLLSKNIKGIGAYRVFCYLPVVIPATVLGFLYKDFFDVRFGLANQLLQSLGLPRLEFFNSAASAMPTFMFTSLWGLGGGMILWLAAIKNVPESLMEAASIDGASKLRKLVSITVPMCTPIIFYNFILGIIGSLQTFAGVMLVAGGPGVENSLMFFSIKIYFHAFKSFDMGYASALAWFMFIIIMMLTMLVFKTSKWVFYGEE